MLLALEDVAAQQAESAFSDVSTAGTSSTWSLERLDALAAEAAAHLVAAAENDDTGRTAASSSGDAGAADRVRRVATEHAQHFPMQAIASVNAVLFDRHGYRPCGRYGEPTDSQMSTVLETGMGSCAALSILYLEVAARLGLQLATCTFEADRYLVMWPSGEAQQPLACGGKRFVVDAYGSGALLAVDEVCELFGVAEPELQPSTRRQLLAALLRDALDTHWARAIGCSPKPAFRVQLSPETALNAGDRLRGLDSAALARALAAARKRLLLVQEDARAQLEYGLLLFFSGQYEDAWLELGIWLERQDAATASAVAAGPDGALPQQDNGAAAWGPHGPSGSCGALAANTGGEVDATAGAAAAKERHQASVLLEKLRLELSVRQGTQAVK